ncbi:hypothetical protein Tco_0748343 [Tanacetum coccineum]|uniref:Uncharacterized protein n=1 Tax=Tanacetum coccineum TaxID=301880 RepID=A0ABQ4YY34_9ASTR
MTPKRTSTSAAPAMTQAAIRKLVADSVAATLEAQAATMANTDDTNRNTRPREAHVARKSGSENRPPMLNKENYVPWSSRLLRDADREVPVPETFHEQTDDELTVAEIKQIEADDQAIQTILLGLPEDIYAAVDSCETAQEIWLRVQQMMKGSDIGIQEKKAYVVYEWKKRKKEKKKSLLPTDGESIESYYHVSQN